MIRRYPHALLAAVLALPLSLGLTGCDPSDAPAAGTALTITPSLGLVRNATVVVKNAAGATVGSGATDNTGIAHVTATGTGPFVIEVQGDSNAEYFDEAANAFLAFPAPRVMRAMIPTGSSNVGVTGLTDVAHALWAANSVPLSNANINASNNAVLNAFAAGSGLTSILTPPNPLASNPSGTLTTSAADVYAAILAGLADLGSSAPSGTPPALTVIEQLRRDISDGSIDGMEGSTAINPLYGNTGFTTNFQTRVDNRISTLGNTALQAVNLTISALTEPTWSSGGTGGTGRSTTPATLNAGLAGTYQMVFEAATGISQTIPFVGGNTYPVTIAANGTLTVNGVPYTTPYHRVINGTTYNTEINWLTPINFEYALSDNSTGTLNEINLYSTTTLVHDFGGYLGQLRVASGGGGGTPTITSFTTSGAVGDNVIINGSGFGTDMFHVIVKFANNVAATVTSVSNDEINVTVPAGAVDGRISVIINDGTPVLTAINFDVTGTTGGGGDAWVTRAKSTGALTNGIAFGNGTFVTAGWINTVQTSSDGIAWTNASLDSTFKSGWYSANNITFDGTRFIMVGDSTNAPTVAPLIAISTDGITWTRRSWTPASTEYNLNDVAAGGGTITAVGGGAIVSSSDGGDTWNNEALPASPAPWISDLRAVASNGSTRVIVGRTMSGGGGGILVNTGSGWTFADSNRTDFCGNDVIWSGEFFLAVGGSDCNFGASAVVMQSQNGSTWTRYALDTAASPAGYNLLGAFMHSDGRVYAVGGDSQRGHVIVSSANGSTWTRELQGQVAAGQGHLKAITGSTSRIVAVGGVSNATKP